MSEPTSGDSGWGQFGDRSCYWDARMDGSGKTDIFPGGTPKSGHDDSPHEHVVIDKDGCVLFWRAEDGEILVDGGKTGSHNQRFIASVQKAISQYSFIH